MHHPYLENDLHQKCTVSPALDYATTEWVAGVAWTEQAEPNRAKLRIDNADPKCITSSRLRLDPNCTKPYTEKPEPKRAKGRIESVLPKYTPSKTLIDEPRYARPYVLKADPNRENDLEKHGEQVNETLFDTRALTM